LVVGVPEDLRSMALPVRRRLALRLAPPSTLKSNNLFVQHRLPTVVKGVRDIMFRL
jgi:hypothetical protein